MRTELNWREVWERKRKGRVEHLGVENVTHKTLKEAGLNLGPLAQMWGIAYLSGRRE